MTGPRQHERGEGQALRDVLARAALGEDDALRALTLPHSAAGPDPGPRGLPHLDRSPQSPAAGWVGSRPRWIAAVGLGAVLTTAVCAVTVYRWAPARSEFQPLSAAEMKTLSPAVSGQEPVEQPKAPAAPLSPNAVEGWSDIAGRIAADRKPPELRVPNLVAHAGAGDIDFPIELDPSGGPAEDLKVLVAGLPAEAKASSGRRLGDGSWVLDPGQLPGLRLTLPAKPGTVQLTVVLTSRDGTELARLSPIIEIQPPEAPRSPFGKNQSEDQAVGLFDQGAVRLADGDVAGARMFFKKAADGGDARAAVAMGQTYDPNLFSSLQVQGMRPDLAAARHWYQRAIDLGSKDALDRLDKLDVK